MTEKFPTVGRSYVIDVATAAFGIGAWIAINGVWVELPVLVANLPEAWTLPSWLSITCQTANVGAVVYGILHQRCHLKPTPAIIPLMVVGVVACLLLANLWMYTTWQAGQLHSVSLLVLVFFLSLVDCTSSVTYQPFMAMFPSPYLISYFVGEGLSGLIPALVALGQGVGGNSDCRVVNGTNGTREYQQVPPTPNFSAGTFFYVLAGLSAFSLAGFLFLRFHPMAKRQHLLPTPPPSSSDAGSERSSIRQSITESEVYGTQPVVAPAEKTTSLTRGYFAYLLAMQTWICCLQNGVMTSVQSYTCLPYGNLAYYLSVTLSKVAAPLASLSVLAWVNSSRTGLALATGAVTVTAAYLMVLAVLSPTPPLLGTDAGTALVVVTWILFYVFATHLKTSVGVILRYQGAQELFWCGAVTQVGSFVGSIVMFVLVDKEDYFVSYDPCDPYRAAANATIDY